MKCALNFVCILIFCLRVAGQEGGRESCTQNELPAISFRVLIFNHTTTQTQKIKGWQSKVAHSRSQRTNNWRPVARQMSSCCCFCFFLHFLDPLSCCVFESPVIVDAAINARHRFNNYLNYSCWNDYGACKCRALSSLTLSLPVSVSLFVSLPVSYIYMLLSLTSALLHLASIPFWNEIMCRINLLVVFTLDVATKPPFYLAFTAPCSCQWNLSVSRGSPKIAASGHFKICCEVSLWSSFLLQAANNIKCDQLGERKSSS